VTDSLWPNRMAFAGVGPERLSFHWSRWQWKRFNGTLEAHLRS
jgi:hypothetical protein